MCTVQVRNPRMKGASMSTCFANVPFVISSDERRAIRQRTYRNPYHKLLMFVISVVGVCVAGKSSSLIATLDVESESDDC